jgi:hypothetical protein
MVAILNWLTELACNGQPLGLTLQVNEPIRGEFRAAKEPTCG